MHKPFVIKSKPFEFGDMGFLNKKPGRFLPLMNPNWSSKNCIALLATNNHFDSSFCKFRHLFQQ